MFYLQKNGQILKLSFLMYYNIIKLIKQKLNNFEKLV